MQRVVQATYRGLKRSPDVERLVRRRAEALEKYCRDIIGCRVLIEAPHKRRTESGACHVVVSVEIPGGAVVVGRNSSRKKAFFNELLAVDEAFDAVRRRLQDRVRRRRLDVKAHATTVTGRVARLFVGRGFGFISDAAGRELWFGGADAPGRKLEDLRAGDVVRFVERPGGERGPRATRIEVDRAAPSIVVPAKRPPARKAATTKAAARPRRSQVGGAAGKR